MTRQCRNLWAAAVAAGAVAMLAGCNQFIEPQLTMDPQRARVDARSKLYQAADDADPTTRVHAIEAMADVVGDRAGGVFLQALDDPIPMVRFAAAMAIGDVKCAPAKAKLVKMSAFTPSTQTGERQKAAFIAVAYALARLDALSAEPGTELGRLLDDPEKDVRALTAMAMGKIGEPSATGPLKAILENEREPMVLIQLHEALAMLGDQRSASVLEAFTKGQFMDDRLVAIQALARVQYRRAPAVLQSLMDERQPPQVRVAAAGALARLGQVDPAGYRLCVEAARDPARMLTRAYGGAKEASATEINSLQGLAAIGLGWMNRTGAIEVLHPLLFSKDGAVRVAAAMSILRLLGSVPTEPQGVTPRPASRPGEADLPTVPKPPKLHTAGGKD